MPDNLKSKKVVLIGPGAMGLEYYKVIKGLGADLVAVVGRDKRGCDQFKHSTGVEPIPHGILAWKKKERPKVDYAIVAVNIDQLRKTACELMELGIKKILIEKPGGLRVDEIDEISKKSKAANAKIYVAYNRRFYASVRKAKEFIVDDGGVTSFHFEFTEWSHLIPKEMPDDDEKKYLVLTNSSHVIDLAFYLGGAPKEISLYQNDSVSWHPSAAVFAGAGQTVRGALFTYQANWNAPGRWGVEVLTRKHRLILRPLEELKVQKLRSLDINNVRLDDKLDRQYKPGLYLQVKSFLNEEPTILKSIEEQVENANLYSRMANY